MRTNTHIQTAKVPCPKYVTGNENELQSSPVIVVKMGSGRREDTLLLVRDISIFYSLAQHAHL